MSLSAHRPSRSLLWRLTPLSAALLLASQAHALELQPQVITANPLGSQQTAAPSTVLEGDELTLQQQGSLGETLNKQPGVSSSYFGPGASRPIIRGLDGDRIRLLRNGVGALDASSLSYDHAVPLDPVNVDRIEIVRGPAALLYGGSAIGGVVNTFDNRIPTEAIEGIHGAGELRYGGADTTRSSAGKLEAGNGTFALHLDANSRQFNDLKIPGYARSRHAPPSEDGNGKKGRLGNSDGRQDGGAIGGSYTWDDGYAGLSYSNYDSNYGSPAEEDVRIRMKQDHYAFASELRNLDGPFSALKFDAGYTDYEHREIEGGETGTIFKNKGYEARVEARHQPLGPLNGVIGTQVSRSEFSALGEEAFVPQTDTDSAALFILEELQATERLKLSLGGRLEHTRVDPDSKGNERFSQADSSSSFTAGSLSSGAVYTLTPIWSVAATLGYTERAPTFYELYANGAHVATGTYEVGDANLSKEKAVSSDLALRFDNGTHKGSVGVFYSHFSNYIGLLGSGRTLNDEGEEDAGGMPEYTYSGVRARFAGIEAQYHWKLGESAYGKFALELSGDYTRAKNLDNGEALPRIAPLRLNSGLLWELDRWQARIDVEHAASQRRVPDNESGTDGYTTLGASAGYHFDIGSSQWLAFVKGENLTNQTVRYASSILRDIAPAQGRSIEVGLRTTF
ncbi:TonB-dependent receptor [Pseudomonas chlororaphis]|uniref:Zinc-regulated outer membrane receptor n=1 Tax=Pseudomonas chlororaphis subsp. aureofaciens TaxID=587851 RepID=A0AAD0ZMV5_9PSED|nr:TonB-dependent receptor [Pseudomonas chlororaphis]AIC22061.1 TonB-dependent receptor [Pseudomonas chlororaphis]AZE25519.1 Zinc-regulated outer membrane receptor [Pseudomonas chlororaphis subsp. aureofaciens]AZE31810.1 Zinc-regulated outer membrane receptor [Pseudomonas chlororaphis subsp. aureofaciens]AZE44435.1 Zinc-regulated outer membrane receptor [Pseudomonas chlororaphis subsp. aureofaciens]KAA5836605.1 TonB-dependent receptor [Pseudomonas chlororaphis]